MGLFGKGGGGGDAGQTNKEEFSADSDGLLVVRNVVAWIGVTTARI